MNTVLRVVVNISLLLVIATALITPSATAATPTAFPADAGVLNVKDYGAVGDGQHDDTQAFLNALAASSDPAEYWHVRIVYVPQGTQGGR